MAVQAHQPTSAAAADFTRVEILRDGETLELKRQDDSRLAVATKCTFCVDRIEHVDYKDIKLLSGFVPERGKVLPRRMFGTCAEHQRKLTLAIKRARQIALLPFASD